MRSKMPLPAATLLAALCLSGCGRQVVFVPPGTVTRLAEDADARVFVKDAQGQWVASANKARIPAGWYVSPPPAAKDAPATRP